ncbi:MAG TPA: undecaprenyl-diphosphate phosphatase [Candidatus Dormibacteraeota bacterium]|nr:undecaprenyl-diphosphate phosphatase [Candidatus Dormibacteraeota bacterium]
MDLFDAVILAVVEGLTEFLPVSSTGHTILTAALLNIAQTPFVKSFEISLEFGSILAVVVLYWRYFLQVPVLKRLIVGFIPTGVVGVLIYPFFKNVLFGNEQVVLWALLLGGVAIILFELGYRERYEIDDMGKIPYRYCLLIGVFQSFSVIPGLSRSAPTIMGGLFLGMKRQTIVLYSFLLAVPTMIAASGYDLLLSFNQFSSGDVNLLLVGFVTSFLVAMPAIKIFLGYVKKHSFIPFGIYRIALVVLFYFFVIL